MPRYIDADALLESLKNFTYAEPCTEFQRGVNAVVPLILSEIKHFPTDDVAPRAEVDRLRSILDAYALQYGTVKDQHKVLDGVKVEAVKEVFAEIEKIVAADDIHEDLEYEELLGAYAAINQIKRKVLEFKMKYVEVGK